MTHQPHPANFKARLALIVLIYLALAVAYSVVTPIGRGADEWAHYWYAQFIAEHGRLPATPAERESAGYKSDWPPLYHALAAAATGWVDTAGPPAFKYRADSLRRQLVPADGSDAILHTLDEQFPWRQEILVWHLGRLLSILFAAGTVVLTYFIGLDVFLALLPNSPPVTRAAANNLRFTTCDLRVTPVALALIAAAALAFTPRFIFTGMLFNYDSLTLLLSTLFLWLSIRVASGYYSRWGFWALGAVAGLALMTKYLAALVPLVIIYLAWVKAAGRPASCIMRSLGQAALAYLLVVGWWFGYLIVTFNEVAQYGPILGTLAPLIRGDGSDRTVETLFAWLSGGQAPPPAHIETQSYGAGRIIASFFTTLWGNPLGQPYPLNWFIVAMTGVMAVALIGLVFYLRFTIYDLRWGISSFARRNPQFVILLAMCLLPIPFMLMRLFGARDALEAVQGRHILFLAGPAIAILLVWGLTVIGHRLALLAAKIHHKPISRSPFTIHYSLFTILLALLLTGSMGQLLAMARYYPPPLPVSAAAPPPSEAALPVVVLPGRAILLDYRLEPEGRSLRATLFWQGGPAFAPEDYRTEWQLIDSTDQPVAQWSGWQTQGRYPTRAWEPGDVVQDSAWLPLDNVPPGEYTAQWRLLGAAGPLFDWQSLGRWAMAAGDHSGPGDGWTVWRDGQPVGLSTKFSERETAQLIFNPKSKTQNPKLIGPDGREYAPVSGGPGWANFIIEPHWPAGSYALAGQPVLAVAESRRDFQPPPDIAPLEADFAGQIKLLGYRLPSRRAEPGDGLPLTLIWQAQAWLGEDLVMFTRLLDPQQAAHGGYDRRARENYSTLLWAPGEVITDGFAVPIAADAPPGVYWLSLGWYRPTAGAESLPLIDPQSGQPTGATAVTIGPIKVGGPPPGATVAQAQPQQMTDIAFGDEIRLVGFDLNHGAGVVNQGTGNNNNSPNSQNSQNSLTLTLYWQALRPPAADYTVFAHVRDQAGNVVAQKDQPPLGGAYPTGLWDAGETIADNISVPLDGVPPGEYEVVVGLYNFADGQRLPVAGSAEGAAPVITFEINAP